MHVIQYAFKIPFLGAAPRTELVTIAFHDWIRGSAFGDDVMIDVADYAHVRGGPGVLLVCHEGHYVVDHSRGASGLSYHRRRGPQAADAVEGPRTGLRRLLRAAAKLVDDPRFDPPVQLDLGALEVRVLDRLRVANDDAGWALVSAPLSAAITELWGSEPALERISADPRQPLTVRATIAGRHGARVADLPAA
jgi:hypothetical protein